MVIVQAFVNVVTPYVGANSTYKISVGTDDDAILATTAVASMTAGVKAGAAASVGLLAAAAETVVLTISTAAATAGKLEVILLCVPR
jgi:hypothetical protein